MDGAARLLALLHEDDEAVEAGLGRAIHQLDALAGLDPAIGPARELLDAALIQLKEAAGVLRAYRDHLDLDPERLDEVDRRLAAVHEMARKHRVRPEELPERLRNLESELAALRTAHARTTVHLPSHVAEALLASGAVTKKRTTVSTKCSMT